MNATEDVSKELPKKDTIQEEIKRQLNIIMLKENFEVDNYAGGDATISVVDHHFEAFGCEIVINGDIRYTVMSYKTYHDSPDEFEISKDGYFEGEIHVSKNEEQIHNEEILIVL